MKGSPFRPRHRRAGRLAAAVLIVAAVLPRTGSAVAQPEGSGSTSGCTAPAATSSAGASFSASETLCRTYFDQGVVDVRNFQVTVSNTQGLRNGQVVQVDWTGAHPTGGIVSDEQFNEAATQEFPVVLMECRGVDSPNVPPAQQISPETCWTASTAERVNSSLRSFQPMWKMDAYNPPAEQANQVNIPASPPQSCGFIYPYAYWLPFNATDGTTYPIGPGGCAGSPSEMLTLNENPNIVPSDTTYAATAPDGTGSAKFTIMTSETNQSLGCSQTVPCSLVIVPIEGISCNANPTYTGQAEYNCENPGDFDAGVLNQGQNQYGPALSDQGTFWWSQSNWGRHISVPLNFATPSDACAAVTTPPIQFYGSELMAQASQQWNPYFCLNPKLFNVEQVELSEPQAKQSVQQGNIEAGIQAAPPRPPAGSSKFFTTPTVQAPIGVTGFGIAYVIDNADGTSYTDLKLNPRLLAKLLTESYYATGNIQLGDPGIAQNPQSVFDDPEFHALNPEFTPPYGTEPAPAATLLGLNSRSDVVWSLTSYIEADPEARAWLDGQPDPWGMAVNPYYRGIHLPVDTWHLEDLSTGGPDYTETGNPFCVAALGTGKARVPDRPLVDNPQNSLLSIAIKVEFGIAASLITCNNNPNAPSYVPFGPEERGARFLMGLVSVPEAEQLDLDLAQLQTYANPEVESTHDPAFLGNRAFVGPSEASFGAAARLMQPDQTSGSWVLPYADLHTTKAASVAYPGTVMVSADIPTTGLPAADATRYGQWLSFAASTGQSSGPGVGQIPAGYLPLTAGNGLGAQVAYTEAAVTDVSQQNGQVPDLSPPNTSAGTTTTTVPRRTTGKSSRSVAVPTSAGTGSGAQGAGNVAVGGSGNASSTNLSRANGGSPPGSGPSSPSGGAYTRQGQTIAVSSPTTAIAAVLTIIAALVGSGWSGAVWLRRRRVGT